MRKTIISKKLLLSILPISLLFFGCPEKPVDFSEVEEYVNNPSKSIALYSFPAGASIYLNGIAQNKFTPDSLPNLSQNYYQITLKLDGYKDTTFGVNIEGGRRSVAVTMTMVPLLIDSYNNIKLYERAADMGTRYSGLVLASGTTVGSTSSSGDLYYDGRSGKDSIYSQHLRPPTSTSRLTDFTPGSASNLDDGVDAPAYSSTSGVWKYSMPSTVGNYYFIFDNDLYYSKFKVIARGGGTGASDPYLWVDVSYKYNKTSKDKRF